jgi:HD-GYP domain-containing protein (c-di-GMP phosphodiesterase class II)
MEHRLSDVLSALSHALDISKGHPRGHAERSCLLGTRLALQLGVGEEERSSLYYALLLKDAGPDVARRLGLTGAADAIAASREHWDGRGEPEGLAGDEIPLLGRIVCAADTAEEFWEVGGSRAACRAASERTGTWFDPAIADELGTLEDDVRFWVTLEIPRIGPWEPAGLVKLIDDDGLDRVAEAFATVVDGQSPYMARHSAEVARLAVKLGRRMDLDDAQLRELYRAGLLHDLGMLGLSSHVLDHRGELDEAERRQLRLHPKTTLEILSRVTPLRTAGRLSAVHHERLDGSGYFLGLTGAQLDLSARVLAVAEVAQALGARRPYRNGFPPEDVLWIMSQGAGTKLDGDVFEALAGVMANGNPLDVVEEVDAEVVHGLEGLGVEPR